MENTQNRISFRAKTVTCSEEGEREGRRKRKTERN